MFPQLDKSIWILYVLETNPLTVNLRFCSQSFCFFTFDFSGLPSNFQKHQSFLDLTENVFECNYIVVIRNNETTYLAHCFVHEELCLFLCALRSASGWKIIRLFRLLRWRREVCTECLRNSLPYSTEILQVFFCQQIIEIFEFLSFPLLQICGLETEPSKAIESSR